MGSSDLDRWAPDPAITIRHQRRSRVGVEALWSAAEQVRLRDARLLGRLIAWRIEGVDRRQTFGGFFRSPPFVVLDEQATGVTSAVAGRIWVVRGGLGRLGTVEEFEAWDEPGTVKVIFRNWVEPDEQSTGSWIRSEVRVQPVDQRGRSQLRLVAPVVSGAQQLIGAEGLRAAVKRAER